MLEKFNSHNYIKNEGTTFQDKRTKYKDTGPDQHTATITAEYSSFIRMLIKTKVLEHYSSHQQLKSLKSYIAHSPVESECEVRDITGTHLRTFSPYLLQRCSL